MFSYLNPVSSYQDLYQGSCSWVFPRSMFVSLFSDSDKFLIYLLWSVNIFTQLTHFPAIPLLSLPGLSLLMSRCSTLLCFIPCFLCTSHGSVQHLLSLTTLLLVTLCWSRLEGGRKGRWEGKLGSEARKGKATSQVIFASLYLHFSA